MPAQSSGHARAKVCVIGAGISGLAAGKMLGDYGVDYDCYESGDRIGGNWAFGNSNGHSSAYRSLHIDTSKGMLRFKDFPMPDTFPDFPHHSQIKEYLELYAEAFDLKSRIRFETAVEHAQRLPDGGWEITSRLGAARYDVLVVANGHHWDPRLPDFPGTFDGPAIHSHHYIDPREPLDLIGKRVLVVGLGNSAADIASEVAQKSVAAHAFISTRSGAYVVPKYILGKPADAIVRTNTHIPLSWQRFAARAIPRLVSGRMEDYGLPTPNHRFLEAHPTGSSELLLRLGSGDLEAKPNVAELRGDRVLFADGSCEDVDAIIYATGYNITFPFFDQDFISAPDNRIALYKRMFSPDVDDVVFIGFAQAIPTLFPFVECQARVLARYVAGTYRPPAPEEMRRVIAADDLRFTGHYSDSPRHTQQTDYHLYEHEMRTKEIPAGRVRVARHGRPALEGRAPKVASA